MATGGIVSLTNAELAQNEADQAQAAKNTYVDQLIDVSISEDLPPDQLSPVESELQSEGNLRTLWISSSFNHVENGQQQRESRIDLNVWGYGQTQRYGDFTLLVKGGKSQSNFLDDSVVEEFQGQHFILQQDDFVLSDAWTMQNTLGVNRHAQNRLVSKSSQVSLKPHLFQGLSSTLYSKETEVRLMLGEKGTVSAVSGFEAGDEQVIGLGLAHHINDSWIAGAQGWRVAGDNIEDELEYSAFIHYEDPESTRLLKLQALNAAGGIGAWLDGAMSSGRFKHQFGAYKVAEDAQWMGEKLGSYNKGAYWRMGYSHPLYTTHTSVDWQQNRSDQRSSIRQSLNYAWDKVTKLGGVAGYTTTENKLSDRQQRYFNIHAAKSFTGGSSNRIELSVKDTKESVEANTGREYELDYSHQWLLADANELGVQWVGRHHDSNTQDYNTYQLGVSWRRDFADGNHLGAKINFSDSNNDVAGDKVFTYRAFGSYQLNPRWSFEGSVELDQHQDIDEFNASVHGTLSFRDSQGKALSKYSRRSGTVRGVAFFDENGDGKRQPLEKAVPDIAVMLNSQRVPVITDNNGEFEFALVGAGEHKLSVREETVPLPWELADKITDEITVKVRQTQYIYLPLVRLDGSD